MTSAQPDREEASKVGKSARIIGEKFNLTAQEVNRYLVEEGYLEGEPGAYGVTEKGEPYASERHFHRGPGGYSWYNADWEQRTWSDEFADSLGIPADRRSELRDRVSEDRRRRREERAARMAEEQLVPDEDDDEPREGGRWSPQDLQRLGLVLAALFVANGAVYLYRKNEPRLRELWINKAAPGLGRLKARVLQATGKAPTQIIDEAVAAEPDGDPAADAPDSAEDVT